MKPGGLKSFIEARRDSLVFTAVLLTGLLFAVATQHAWEDYWITFRSSRNLAAGNGLVYRVGERLHTFTSPLGVLLPAGLSWLTGNRSDDLVLWLFRAVSAGALAGGVVLLSRASASLHRHRAAKNKAARNKAAQSTSCRVQQHFRAGRQGSEAAPSRAA